MHRSSLSTKLQQKALTSAESRYAASGVVAEEDDLGWRGVLGRDLRGGCNDPTAALDMGLRAGRHGQTTGQGKALRAGRSDRTIFLDTAHRAACGLKELRGEG
jgi:hypothetical protein